MYIQLWCNDYVVSVVNSELMLPSVAAVEEPESGQKGKAVSPWRVIRREGVLWHLSVLPSAGS